MDSITPVIGLIGGSGLYDIDGLEDREWRHVSTPGVSLRTNCSSAASLGCNAFSSPSWPRPPQPALGVEFPRQY